MRSLARDEAVEQGACARDERGVASRAARGKCAQVVPHKMPADASRRPLPAAIRNRARRWLCQAGATPKAVEQAGEVELPEEGGVCGRSHGERIAGIVEEAHRAQAKWLECPAHGPKLDRGRCACDAAKHLRVRPDPGGLALPA